jgi:hypothetical protein
MVGKTDFQIAWGAFMTLRDAAAGQTAFLSRSPRVNGRETISVGPPEARVALSFEHEVPVRIQIRDRAYVVRPAKQA